MFSQGHVAAVRAVCLTCRASNIYGGPPSMHSRMPRNAKCARIGQTFDCFASLAISRLLPPEHPVPVPASRFRALRVICRRSPSPAPPKCSSHISHDAFAVHRPRLQVLLQSISSSASHKSLSPFASSTSPKVCPC